VATVALVAQALRNNSNNPQRVESLSHRLDELTRAIHHHIDSQMMNARLLNLPRAQETISASGLVRQALKDFPFESTKASQCVDLVEHQDFHFLGSSRQFGQVLDNLIKNALHSLKASQSRLDKGDLRIEIGTRDGIGRIEVSDNGVGIEERNLHRIFEPFFSTSSDTGHGLGLAYCMQVVTQAGGTLRARARPALGATFCIDLPCYEFPPVTSP
jgi:two-component system, CAI-1 autoinducer sensor kinase/phosphatase CqsS